MREHALKTSVDPHSPVRSCSYSHPNSLRGRKTPLLKYIFKKNEPQSLAFNPFRKQRRRCFIGNTFLNV